MISKKRRVLETIIFACLCISIIGFYFAVVNKNNFYGDAFFHVGRIKEIRYAFEHFEIPNLLNFQSFFGIGQAVNAMYPDISLWPLVLVTMPFSPAHQVAMIKVLIPILTLLVSYFSLRRKRIPSDISLYSSMLIVLYGTVIESALEQFTTGIPIVYIFVAPIAFVVYDLVSAKQFDKILSIKFALVIILILYSHYLTIVILAFIITGAIIFKLINKSYDYHSLENIFMGGLLSLVGVLPILFRYVMFTKAGLTMPYAQGKIVTVSQFPYRSPKMLFLIIVATLAPCIFFKTIKNKIKYFYLIIFELYLFLLGTNFFPWRLFDKVPVINNLQFSDRFFNFVYIIPILILTIFATKHVKLGIVLMLLLIGLGITRVSSMYNNILTVTKSSSLLTESNYSQVGKVTGRLSKSVLENNRIYFFYDYYPDEMPNSYQKTWTMSKKGINFVANPKVKGSFNSVLVTKKSINNGVQIKPTKTIKSKKRFLLPVLGYQGLTYKTYVNGHIVSNRVVGMRLAVHSHKLTPSDTITVKYLNPPLYTWLIIIALLYDLSLMVLLYRDGRKENDNRHSEIMGIDL